MTPRRWTTALALASCCGCGYVHVVPADEHGHSFGVNAAVLFKRPDTFPNLTLVSVGDSKEKVVIHPCRPAGGKTGLSTSDPVCGSVAVGNIGPGDTELPVEVALFLDGGRSGTWILSNPIRSGEIVGPTEFTFGPLASGVHTFRAVIDPSNRIGETDESDNEAMATFTVSEAP